jgi:hypothetical protein
VKRLVFDEFAEIEIKYQILMETEIQLQRYSLFTKGMAVPTHFVPLDFSAQILD